MGSLSARIDATVELPNNYVVDAMINSAANIADTKLATISTPGKIAESSLPSDALPLGMIVAVVDDYANVSIPASGDIDIRGFQLCDGAALNVGATVGTGTSLGNFVPNLSDGRFLRGSATSGTTGGAASVTLIEANLPSHSHDIGHGHADDITVTGFTSTDHTHSGTSGGGGGHSHTFTTLGAGGSHTHGFATGVMSANGSHTHGFTTGGAGGHSHTDGTYKTGSSGGHNHYVGGGAYANTLQIGTVGTIFGCDSAAGPDCGWRYGGNSSSGPLTNTVASHTHDVTGFSGAVADHSHTGTTNFTSIDHTHSGTTNFTSIQHSHTGTASTVLDHTHGFTTGAMSANGSHQHTIGGGVTAHVGASGAVGGGTSFSIEPQYLNVKYLIKVA